MIWIFVEVAINMSVHNESFQALSYFWVYAAVLENHLPGAWGIQPRP